MRKTLRTLLVTSNPKGDLEALEKLVKVVPDTGADALFLIGNLFPKSAHTRDYGIFFRILAQANRPTYYIPGPEDAPIWEYLREAANVELVHPHMKNIHGSFAFAPGPYVVAGMGGEVIDEGKKRRRRPSATPLGRRSTASRSYGKLRTIPKSSSSTHDRSTRVWVKAEAKWWPNSSKPTTPWWPL